MDGIVNDGAELFGCITPQTRTIPPNGFNALKGYGKLSKGGNGDGKINQEDSVF